MGIEVRWKDKGKGGGGERKTGVGETGGRRGEG